MLFAFSAFRLNNFVLVSVKSVTYLGTEIDETLSWSKQTENLPKNHQIKSYIILNYGTRNNKK